MTSKDSLGDRMKSYETPYMQRTVPRMPMVIRVDGSHFHSFTRGFAKPFDPVLIAAMQGTMLDLCADITGAVFGYTQSDEITIVCRLADLVDGKEYYEGRVNKILSITASKATAAFNRNFAKNVEALRNDPASFPETAGIEVYQRRLLTAEFDARVMSIPDSDVYNCLIWRQMDASRNSLSMLAQAHFPQKQLQGRKREELMDMLMLEKGINWNDLPTVRKRGSCCYRKDIGRTRPKWFLDTEMPVLTSDEGRSMLQPLLDGRIQCIRRCLFIRPEDGWLSGPVG